jgi:hypothetical protein
MTANEFYQIVKEYAKNEMFEQGKKAVASDALWDIATHTGASNEAAKFYQMIENLWLDNAEQKI